MTCSGIKSPEIRSGSRLAASGTFYNIQGPSAGSYDQGCLYTFCEKRKQQRRNDIQDSKQYLQRGVDVTF